MFGNNLERPAVFKNSGRINGRDSIFVMPAVMPVTMSAVPVTMPARISGWASVAVAMAADVDENPAVPIGTERMPNETRDDQDGALDFHFDDGVPFGNAYAYADKDAGWQAGVS